MGFESYRAIFEKNCTLATGLASVPCRRLATGRSAGVKDLAAKLVASESEVVIQPAANPSRKRGQTATSAAARRLNNGAARRR